MEVDMTKTEEVYVLTHQIRTLFHKMARAIDTLHEGSGVSAGQRAILEALEKGAGTVPEMARQRSVSRQHIQLLTNELLDKGLVESLPNPAHKKSPLIQKTSRGAKVFAQLRSDENGLLERLAGPLEVSRVAIAQEVLARLDEQLNELSASFKQDGEVHRDED